MTIPSAEPKKTQCAQGDINQMQQRETTSASIRNTLDKKGVKIFLKTRKCIKAASPQERTEIVTEQNTTQGI
jgi:hypothetical protein